jgi:hypothetical protein
MMTNKLVRVQNGNPAYLSFGVNKKIDLLNNDWSFSRSDREAYGDHHLAVRLYDALRGITLVTDVTVRSYEISVEFADAFMDDDEERSRIRDEATAIIDSLVFADATEPTVITDRDDRERFTRYDDAA